MQIAELSQALAGTWLEGGVDLTNGFFRQDVTEPDDPKDNWTVFCDIQESLKSKTGLVKKNEVLPPIGYGNYRGVSASFGRLSE